MSVLGEGDVVVNEARIGASGGSDRGTSQALAGGWGLAVREFVANRLGVVGVVILLGFVALSFFGPHLYHTNQLSSNPVISDLPPGAGHPLGTDDSGFDELGRIMKAGQATLEIGLLSAVIATGIGTVYGAVSGLVGGVIDGLLMRVVDVLLSIPFLFVVLIVATKYRATVLSLSLILGVFSWLVPARLVRGEVRSLRERDFVAAGRVMGSSQVRLVFRHLIPNALSVIIVNVTFLVADGILAVAYIGFLGFGLSFPNVSWGDMLGNAQNEIAGGYWWLVYPVGGCLILVVLACNFIGGALRDAFDVRLRRR